VGVLGPGGHACDLDVLARSQHRHSIVALTDVDVLVIDRRSLYGLLDEMPALAARVVSDLAQRLRALETDGPEA
jgi:CRP-like cAMP-binding protein